MHWRRMRDVQTMCLSGVKLNTGKDDVPHQVRNALFKETYERHERELVSQQMSHGDRVLEIGCGIGLVSLLASKICGEGNVFSYEANPRMKDVILANYALNGLAAKLVMQPVTADGRDIIFHRQDNVLSSSIYDRGADAEEISIQSTAIEDALRQSRADAVIMDVEGAEAELLTASDFANVNTMIIEMHPHIIGAQVVADLCDQLAEKGLPQREIRHKTYLFAR